MQKVWILCGGPSTEFEVSVKSARVVCENISLEGRKVRPVVVKPNGRWLIWDRELEADHDRRSIEIFFESATNGRGPGVSPAKAVAQMVSEQIHCVFNAMHGQFGEDGTLQGFLDTAGVPYTGSGLLASAIAFHKAYSLGAYRMAGLRVPNGWVVSCEADLRCARELNLPVFVKPVRGGSSVGLSLVRDWEELPAAIDRARDRDYGALVEERVEGTEVSCGVLDLVQGGDIVTRVLPPTEIRPVESEFFDYEAKYTAGKTREITPAELSEQMIARVQEFALAAHRVLGCEGMSRTDMIVPPDGSDPVVLETNTIPGLTPTSLLPQQAAAIGIDVPGLFDCLIENAVFRAHRAKVELANR